MGNCASKRVKTRQRIQDAEERYGAAALLLVSQEKDMDQLREELEEAKEDIDEATNDAARYCTRTQELEEKVSVAKAEAAEELAKVKEELAGVKKELTAVKKELTETLKETIQGGMKRASEHRRAFLRARETNRVQSTELKRLGAECVRLAEEHEREKNSLQWRLIFAHTELKKVQNQEKEFEKECDRLSMDLAFAKKAAADSTGTTAMKALYGSSVLARRDMKAITTDYRQPVKVLGCEEDVRVKIYRYRGVRVGVRFGQGSQRNVGFLVEDAWKLLAILPGVVQQAETWH